MEASVRWQGFESFDTLSRLTMIPLRTLQRWRKLGIIVPSAEMEDEGTITEGYTYAYALTARLIRGLREDHYDFKAAADALRHLFSRLGPAETGWAGARVYFKGRFIFADQPDDWAVTEATHGGQRVFTDLFGEVFPELRLLDEGTNILVPEEYREVVEINPDVMNGLPVVRGNTRSHVPSRFDGHSWQEYSSYCDGILYDPEAIYRESHCLRKGTRPGQPTGPLPRLERLLLDSDMDLADGEPYLRALGFHTEAVPRLVAAGAIPADDDVEPLKYARKHRLIYVCHDQHEHPDKRRVSNAARARASLRRERGTQSWQIAAAR